VPESETVCGLPLVLSETVSEAARLPVAEASNDIAIVQCAPAASEAPQVLTSLKSAAFAPVKAMLVIAKAAVPLFVRVATWDALLVSTGSFPNARLEGEMLVPAPEVETVVSVSVACPVPLRLVALSVTVEVPAVVKVPEINPVPLFTVNPAGNPVAP